MKYSFLSGRQSPSEQLELLGGFLNDLATFLNILTDTVHGIAAGQY